MSDFGDALFDLLPLHSPLHNPNNQGRKVIDNTIGEWFDNHDVLDFYEQLFLDTATGAYLDLFGADYGVARQLDEGDDDYRTRIIQEKNDHLTPSYLKSLYGLRLYAYVTGFDATDNDLTSDNEYIKTGRVMAETTSDIENRLNKHFIIDDEIVWIHNNVAVDTKSLTVNVYWDDKNDYDGNRPDNLVVRLYSGSVLVAIATVDENSDWIFTFNNLPIYDGQGAKIVYNVTVDEVTDYNIIVSETDVMCKYNPELKTLSIVKSWDDNDDEHGVRPDTVEMIVKQNNVNYNTVIISEETNWQGTISVPIRKNGVSASYSWSESSFSNYVMTNIQTEDNSTTITNTYSARPVPP